MKTILNRSLIISILTFTFCLSVNAQDEVKVYEENITFPTYKINKPDVNPMFFKGESYQGASKVIYPYPLLDNLTNEKVDQDWIGLFLENEYIKACITPEIGGKLYWAEDKSNGYNFFYKNNVVKPANIGMLGAWVSGGIEWCIIHHHRASTFMPVNYTLKENEDGSKTIWFGEIEPRQHMKWIIGLTVYPGKSYIEAEVKIINRTPYTNTFLYWANVATHANKDYQCFFPPSTDFGVDHSKIQFTHWPISKENYRDADYTDGVDISMWKNHPKPTSVFCHDLKDDFMGGYDHGKNAGTVHVGNHNIVKGAKLWEWGPSELAQMWDKVLSDEDGSYAEIMVGAYSNNQPDYSWIRPFEVKTVKQYWYPIKDIGGIIYANMHGAANLKLTDAKKAFFGFSVTEKFENAKAVLFVSGEAVFEKQITIDPGNAFTTEVTLPKGVDETDIKIALIDNSGKELITYQPIKKEYVEELPEVVKPPLAPKDIKSVEQLYLTGLRLRQFHNPKKDPSPYFEEALKRDPGNSDVNTHLGNEALRKGDYEEAAKRYRIAINRLSKDYTRPEKCAAYYSLGQVLKTWENYDDAIDTLYRATWDYSYSSAGYYLLAEISCIQKDYQLALEQVTTSLYTNSISSRAINLQSSIYRLMGNYEESVNLAQTVLIKDPINFRASNELYLSLKASGKSAEAEKVLESLNKTMRNDHNYYLEIAVEYLNSGMYNDALQLLLRYEEIVKGKKEIDPMIYYYIGYLYAKTNNVDESVKYYKSATALSTDYCFPNRLETIKVLNAALEINPNDAKAFYYLGNILYDRQPQIAIKKWEKAVELDNSLAIAHRNLGWAYYRAENDIPKAIKSYEAALENKKDDPMYYNEIDRLYELNGTSPQKRLQLLEPNHDIVKKRNDSFLREIMVLNLSGKYDKSVDYLTNNHFHIREGDMKIRDINVDAHLLLGKSLFEEEKYEEALKEFELANTYPDNQQVGRDLNDHRIPQIHYFIGLANDALGNSEQAKEYFNKSVDQDIKESQFSYYQGLAYLKLGNKEKATEIFDDLIASGTELLSKEIEDDVFAKFGESESDDAIQAGAHLKIGLGYAGKNNIKNAKAELSKAVELNVSNLWANIELMEL